MLETISVEKVDKENDVICLASMLPWSLNCPKKCGFYNFVLARNLSLLKQFTGMHLKLIMRFQ